MQLSLNTHFGLTVIVFILVFVLIELRAAHNFRFKNHMYVLTIPLIICLVLLILWGLQDLEEVITTGITEISKTHKLLIALRLTAILFIVTNLRIHYK